MYTMTDERRKTIAFLCGMYLSNINCSSIFDYTRGSYYNLNYSVIGNIISVFDYERSCELSGQFPSFHDYGAASAVNMKVIREGVIDAYDYKTATDMEVTCKGKNISLFDYKVGRFFEYQLG